MLRKLEHQRSNDRYPQTFKFEDHSIDGTFYQDSLFRVYILNASFALRVMWNVARMFMHPVTAQKVQIYGNAGPDVIKTLVDQGIPLTAIPSYLHKDARGANPIGMIGNSTRKQVLNVYGKKETETLTVRVPKNQDVSWSVRVQGRSSEGARVRSVRARSARISNHPIFLSYHKNITYITLFYHSFIPQEDHSNSSTLMYTQTLRKLISRFALEHRYTYV